MREKALAISKVMWHIYTFDAMLKVIIKNRAHQRYCEGNYSRYPRQVHLTSSATAEIAREAEPWNDHSRSLKVTRCCANRGRMYRFLLTLNSNLIFIFNRFRDITPSLHIHTPPFFHVELETVSGHALVSGCQNYATIKLIRVNLHSMITMHARPRQTDGRTS